MFFLIVLTIWTLMHVYVLARLSSVPVIARHIPFWLLVSVGSLLGASYIGSRMMERAGYGSVSHVVEYIGANWVGVLFVALVCFLVADIATGFGWLFRTHVPLARSLALVAAVSLSVVAFVQAWREPIVTEYEVTMPGLPVASDRTVVVVASDMHLGAMLGHDWAQKRAAQFASLKPDVLILAGDIFEAERETHDGWLPVLQQFRAPKGVFVVTGNHELYAGPGPIIELFRRAGFRVLRDEAVEAFPGLVIGGVDDIAFRRRNKDAAIAAVGKTLANRPSGATIFVSHTPVHAPYAAELGASLMFSGHTHNGQIWPFTYAVQSVFPLINGRYQVGSMTAIVGRGTGTWGPRMRLWKRSELLRVTLRAQ